jgi:predicted N-acetyltransferase YhbS
MELDALFVAPEHIGTGLGKALMGWAIRTARAAGAARLSILSDPHAAPFYRHLGARDVGSEPSPPPPGRTLPLLHLQL